MFKVVKHEIGKYASFVFMPINTVDVRVKEQNGKTVCVERFEGETLTIASIRLNYRLLDETHNVYL